MKTRYTAQEMREMALVEESYRWDVVAKMLRQGADAIEQRDKLLAENAHLKSDISELLKCLQKIYDEECTGFGTGDVFNRISEKMNGGAK